MRRHLVLALLLPAALAPPALTAPMPLIQPTKEGGELLLGELGCVHCHQTESLAAARLTTRESPQLAGIMHRVQAGYLERWLENPHDVKPGTVMPRCAVVLSPAQASSSVRPSRPVMFSQIPEGFAGPANPLDSSRCDVSPWLDQLPVIREFKRKVLRRSR